MGSWLLTGLFAVWAFAVAVYDVRQRRVPNALLILLAVPSVLSVVLDGHGMLGASGWASLAGLAIGAAPLFAGYLIHQVGAGDVKLSGLQGFVLGSQSIGKALLISGVVLGLMSAYALLGRNRKASQSRLPAALALVIGFVATLLLGHLPSGWGT